MAVYFVFRHIAAGPSGKSIRRIEAASILDVFRAHWRIVEGDPGEDTSSEEEMDRRGRRVFGPGYTCLTALWYEIAANDWRPPRSLGELHERWEWLASTTHINGFAAGPHHLAILDTNDVFEFALYVFDDEYVALHSDRVTYLLRPQWKLPVRAKAGAFVPVVDCPVFPQKGEGEGVTYAAILGVEDDDHHGLANLDTEWDASCWRIEGVRLPELPLYLLTTFDPNAEERPFGIRAFHAGFQHFLDSLSGYERAFFDEVRAEPPGELAWAAYSDWLEEQGRPRASVHVAEQILRRCPSSRWSEAGERSHDTLSAHTHIAQVSKRFGTARHDYSYRQIILFDDYWAAANADLANAILRYATNWNVLG